MSLVPDSDYESLLEFFFTEFVHVTREVLEVDLKITQIQFKETPKLSNDNQVLSLLDFRGSSIGFLSIQCAQDTLNHLCKNVLPSKTLSEKTEIKSQTGAILKELLNNVSGLMLPKLKPHLPIITILSPKLIYGEISFPETPCRQLQIDTHLGEFTFTICLDEMQLDVLRLLDEAQQASKAKGEFLATMSHEFRTPIHGMMGMTELLYSTPLNTEQKDYLQSISESANALLSIVNDILDYSKVEAGKMEMENIDFDLYSLANSSIDIVSPKVYSKDLNIALIIAPNVPKTINSDPTRLRQVFLNLLSNAVKFTEKGHIIFEIKLSQQIEEDIEIEYSISDTGIGIPKESQEKLFQSFYQVDPSHSRKYGGTGLGLAICKMLIQKMGGDIYIKSQEDQGTTFTFRAKHQIGSPKALLPLKDLTKKHFLLISDQEFDKFIFEKYIEVYGGQLHHFPYIADYIKDQIQNPRKQYENAYLNPPSIIEMSKNHKEDIDFIKLKTSGHLVFISNYLNRGETSLIKNLGFDLQLSKPIKPNLLLDSLQDIAPTTTVTKESPLYQQNAQFSCKVLIAEDNPINQKVISKMFEKMNIDFDIANNGLEAVEMFQAAPYDIIFMDFQMPVMDGIDATIKIRETSPLGARIPIVALTANVNSQDKEKAFAVGMNDFLAKPMNSVKLSEIIQTWTQNS